MQIVWTSQNVNHIETSHGVTQDEVEEVFYNNPRFQISNSQPDDPKRYLAFGRTDEGRYLMVVFVKMENGNVKPFSARDMTPVEKRNYKKVGQ